MKNPFTLLLLLTTLHVSAQKEITQPNGSKSFHTFAAVATTFLDGGYGGEMSLAGRIAKGAHLGAGLDVFKLSGLKGVFLPAFITFKFQPIKVLFLDLQGGYSYYNQTKSTRSVGIPVNTKTTGGFYYGIGAGITGNEKNTFFMQFNLSKYSMHIESENQNETFKTTNSDASLTLTMGLRF